MSLLRIEVHAPDACSDRVARVLASSPHAVNRTVLRGALLDPPGDLLACDVPREEADRLLEALDAADLDSDSGVVTVHTTLVHPSRRAHRAEDLAPGAGSDAVVWQVLRDQLDEERHVSGSYLAFMVLATLLGVIGVLTNSAILVVGAMVLGPEFGPLANVIVGCIDRSWARVRDGIVTLFLGFTLAIVVASLFVLAMDASGIFPDSIPIDGIVANVASPGWLSLIIALIAGAAGTLAMTSNRSGSLIGVLISVTTIPAASDAAALLAYGDNREAIRAMFTLAINLGGMTVAGLASLAAHRAWTRRSRRPASAASRTLSDDDRAP